MRLANVQPAWTWADRIIIRLLATPVAGVHLVWE